MTYRDTRTDPRIDPRIDPRTDPRTDDPVMSTPAVTRERAVERQDTVMGAPGPGMILGLVGALGIIASLFMSWRDPAVHPDDVPLRFLFDNGTTAHHPSLLLVLIPLVALVVIGALLPAGAVLRIIGGLGTLAVVALFIFQVDDLVIGGSTFDVLDVGLYICAIGGIFALLSGFVPAGWRSRRTVERELDAR